MTATSEPPVRFARINGRRWRIELVETLVDSEGAPNLGQCDADDRRIALRIGPRHQLQDTLFHELVHAACPSLDEDTVLEVERGVFAVLTFHRGKLLPPELVEKIDEGLVTFRGQVIEA